MKKQLSLLGILSAMVLLAECGGGHGRPDERTGQADPTAETDPTACTETMRTSDEMYWNGKHYYMNASPMERFDGYIELFHRLPDPFFRDRTGQRVCHSRPLAFDKTYTIRWKIADSMLYVAGFDFFTVGIYCSRAYIDTGEEPFAELERLTGERFDRTSPAARIRPQSPYGAMPARWFSGRLCLKPYPDWDFTSYKQWQAMPVYELTFRDGKLLGVRERTGKMVVGKGHDRYLREDPAASLRPSATDPAQPLPDTVPPESAVRSLYPHDAPDRIARVLTSDEMLWDGRWYNMSRSPLQGEFPKFTAIYSDLPGPGRNNWENVPRYPVVQDKGFSALWQVADSSLYLVDLDFYTLEDPKNDLELFWELNVDDRFRTIEKLTGRRFVRDGLPAGLAPGSDYGALPATWFSGAIYIKKRLDKRNPKADYGPWRRYPVRKLTFENGRLARVEEVDGTMID